MAFKLTKDEQTELDQLKDAFDTARDALREHLAAVQERLQGEFDDKSAKWQDGDKGIAATEVLDALGALVDEIEGYEPDLDTLPL